MNLARLMPASKLALALQATSDELHTLRASQKDTALTGPPIEKIQYFLQRTGLTVPISGVLDKATQSGIQEFQKEQVDRNGFMLPLTGDLDPATLEALFYGRRRMAIAIANFILLTLILAVLYLWNANFWSEENKARRDLVNVVIISGLAALFGIRSVSALLVPSDTLRIKAFWYRVQTQLTFTIGLCIALATAVAMYGYYPKQGLVLPIPKDKRLIHIAIVLNGTAPYAREIMHGFTEAVDKLLETTKYAPNYEYAIGEADVGKDEQNKVIFENVFAKFPAGRPDYLVTIGTVVTTYADKHYLNSIPIIFIGVTDPIRSGLATRLEKDIGRGNIAGVTYGIPALTRASFVAQAFPEKRVGFIYSPAYPQDVYMKDQILALASTTKPRLDVVPIEVSSPSLTPDQLTSVDVFFGYYYLDLHFSEFAEKSPKPFIGATLIDARKRAVITIANDDKKLGGIAADRIFFRNLLRGVALSDLDIESPDTAIVAINQNVARRYGITVSQAAITRAQIIFDE